MSTVAQSAPADAGARMAPPAGAARRLLWRMIWVYVQGSAAAVLVVLLLVLLGLEFTLRQWMYFAGAVPVVVAIYVFPDIYLIARHFRPIGTVLRKLESGATVDRAETSGALARALNLPFLAFMRVSLFHGPAAALLTAGALVCLNLLFDAGFRDWQVWIFGLTVLLFASPTHAIFEFFAIARHLRPVLALLWQHCDRLRPEDEATLISIRLKNKLLYLSIAVTALPLVFFAGSVVFKVDLLLREIGVDETMNALLPLWLWIGGVVVACLVGALTMSILTAREVSDSASRLQEALTRVQNGDLSTSLHVTGTDEYAEIYRGFNAMTEALRDEQRILEVSNDLSGELQLDVLLQRIMRATTELLDADRSTLFVYDPKADQLWSRVAEGLGTREIRIPTGEGISGHVFTSGRMDNVSDPYKHPLFNPEIDRRTGYQTRSILCMPIVNKTGERIGVTQVLNKREGAFTRRDEARLRAFTAQIAISLENAQLFDEVLNIKNYNESILRSTSNGLITIDTEHKVVTVNEAACRLLHAGEDQLVGREAAALFGEENGWVLRSIEKVEETSDIDIAVDADLVLQDEARASVNLTTVPLIDTNEDQIGTMLMLEDISGEKRVKTTMARYMSKEVVDQLLEGGESELGGKDQNVTILFSDVRGFTSVSETLGARETVAMLNEYFAVMVDVIFQHGGILDKYIGDAIMALFGAPFSGPQDADRAVLVGNDMMRALRQLNAERAARGQPPLDIGIGMSTGDVVAGNIGSPKRMEYTVIGDPVNLASRLEGANKFYGTKILLSEHTVRQLSGAPLLREIDMMRVKGKDEPVSIYEALDHHNEQSFPNLHKVLEIYTEGLRLYRERRWEQAARLFQQALGANFADQPTRLHLERCRRYIEKPPPRDWDGVFSMAEK